MFNELTKGKAYDNYSLFTLDKIVKNIQKYLKAKEITIDIENNSLSNAKTGEYFNFTDSEAIYSKNSKSIKYNLKSRAVSGDKDFIIDIKKNKFSTYYKFDHTKPGCITSILEVQFTLEENIHYLVDYICFCKKLFLHKNNSSDLLCNITDWKNIYQSCNLNNFILNTAISTITFIESVVSLDSKDFINNIVKDIKPIKMNKNTSHFIVNKKEEYKVFLNISENIQIFLYNKRLFLEFSNITHGDNHNLVWPISDFELKIKENKKIKETIEIYIEKIKKLEPLVFEITKFVNLIQPTECYISLNKDILDLYALKEDLSFPNLEEFFKNNKSILKYNI